MNRWTRLIVSGLVAIGLSIPAFAQTPAPGERKEQRGKAEQKRGEKLEKKGEAQEKRGEKIENKK